MKKLLYAVLAVAVVALVVIAASVKGPVAQAPANQADSQCQIFGLIRSTDASWLLNVSCPTKGNLVWVSRVDFPSVPTGSINESSVRKAADSSSSGTAASQPAVTGGMGDIYIETLDNCRDICEDEVQADACVSACMVEEQEAYYG